MFRSYPSPKKAARQRAETASYIVSSRRRPAAPTSRRRWTGRCQLAYPPTRQHVAIGLGNAVRELASPCTGLGPMVKCPTAALRRRRYGARTDQQPPALLRGSRQGQFWRVRLLQRPRTAPGFQTRMPSPLMVRPQSLSLRISSFATYLSCRNYQLDEQPNLLVARGRRMH